MSNRARAERLLHELTFGGHSFDGAASVLEQALDEQRELERALLAVELEAARSTARALADELEGALGLTRTVVEQIPAASS